MILYHGSNLLIEQIDLQKCRPNKDFGKGFYLTDIYEQAEKMAKRVAKLYGGSPFVTSFALDMEALQKSNLSIKEFMRPNREWAMFVMNNRSKRMFSADEDNNADNRYDVVIGPVANDDMAVLFRQFESGFITTEMLVREMEYKQMTSQYSFHTEKAIGFLKKVEA